MRILLLIFLLSLPTISYADPDCDKLRRACEMRGELGERGEGNCRRYKDLCTVKGSTEADRCEQLREKCLYKKENSEEGKGNCRHYRDECR